MAQRLAVPSKELQLHIVGPRDTFKASRVQRVSMTAEIPAEDKDELGNPQHVGTAKDTPNVTVTFSAFDVGIKIFAALTGVDPNAYPAAGVDVSSLSEVDTILFVKDAVASDYVKSIHGHRLQVRDFTFNYQVDGDSTEDYTAIGSERRYLKYDVVVDKFASGTTSFALSQTPIQLKNGNYALSVTLDGEYLTEVSSAPGTGEFRVVGTTLTTGDTRTAQVLVIYHSNPAGNNWSDVNDPSMPAAIRGKDVDVMIVASGVTTSLTRVQSVNINGNLNVQAVKELGNRAVVGYQRQVPTIEGTLTVLDTDSDLISLLTEGVVGSGIEWQPGEGCTTVDLSLKIELVDPCDDDASPQVLKTVYLPSITVTSDGYTSNVNNNAQQTFNFRSLDAQVIIYSGAMP
jgi:hypothetical protein